MSMPGYKQAIVLALLSAGFRPSAGSAIWHVTELHGTGSGVYSIQGIAVIPPRPRLGGTGRIYLHPAGGGVQFEAKMNFQRPARSFRFSGFVIASLWTDTYCEPLTYAQLGHSDSRRIRVAFIHPVPADEPKQQSFL
jgi:hypothetical protein